MDFFDRKIEPDVDELIDVIRRNKPGRRVHVIELFLDQEIKNRICERFQIGAGGQPAERFAGLKRDIALYEFLGYDVFRIADRTEDIFGLKTNPAADTTEETGQSRGQRAWQEERVGTIRSWEDFEKHRWPTVPDIDFGAFEWMDKNLPANMGCYNLTASIFETVSFLLGYETMCLKMFDEPRLVDAIYEQVGRFYLDYTRALCDFSSVKLIWGSDDFGFRTGTLVSTRVLRESVLPWHKKCARIAHEHDRPYLMHSCGKIDEIMDDLIDDVGIDAKHSFEDVITPVSQFKKRYGGRLAVLGGIDVDFLCRQDEEAVREKTRQTLRECLPGGGYCLGTGNTVANYIPLDNYLAMLDEGRRFGS
jgi:uroporphyrinogen decarboxylase